MLVNVILDSRNPAREEQILNELHRQGITDYLIWPCLMYATVVSSINASHKMIVRDAKENGLEEVCIWEDDCHFTHPRGWEYFLENKPEIYDLYLGGNYALPLSNRKIIGFHCYILHARAYDKYLSVPDNVHIDTAMEDILNWTACYPFAAVQRRGFSSNTMSEEDKNVLLSDIDIYGGLPE
jgi:hypothetical protein